MKGRIFTIACSVAVVSALGSSPLLAQPPEHAKQHKSKTGAQHHQPVTIEEAVIRAIFRAEPALMASQPDLPPGIRKNLARGKPLPPGLAKRFDSRLEARLPHYPGYEWRQVGRDAVLVAATTGIIEAILNNIFD